MDVGNIFILGLLIGLLQSSVYWPSAGYNMILNQLCTGRGFRFRTTRVGLRDMGCDEPDGHGSINRLRATYRIFLLEYKRIYF